MEKSQMGEQSPQTWAEARGSFRGYPAGWSDERIPQCR